MACPTTVGSDANGDVPQRWSFDGCFGCGDVHGLRMSVRIEPERVVTGVWTVEPRHQGASGLAHGGALAAAFDELLGAVQFYFGEAAVTASLTTNFLAPIPVGSTVHLVARPRLREGRKIRVDGEARIGDPEGPLAARAEALFVFVGEEHFARFGAKHSHAAAPLDT